jgi:hypothetical protein
MKLALLSVYDKTGIDQFAINLAELGYTILASGGTAKSVSKALSGVDGVSRIPRWTCENTPSKSSWRIPVGPPQQKACEVHD